MAEINDFINEDADVIFSTEESSNENKEIVEYKIIISGIGK